MAIQLEVFRSVLRFRRDRSAEIGSAVSEAPAVKAAAGLNRSEPFHLFGADNDPSAPDEVLDPPPCAYRLDAGQVEALATPRALWSLRIEQLSGAESVLVMDQPFMTVIPLLTDGRARDPLVAAAPMVAESECAALRSPRP